MEKKLEKKCCICGKKFVGYGNNPYPIKNDGQCCDKCNELVCIARLKLSLEQH